MPVETIVIWLIVGAVAGLLAGLIVKGGGFGLLGDIVVGIIGAFVGGWLLPRLGIHLGAGLVSVIASATIGAIIFATGLAVGTARLSGQSGMRNDHRSPINISICWRMT